MDHVAETMADSLCGEIVSVMASSTANEVVLEAQADSQAESMAHEFDEIDRYGIELCDRLALTQLLDVIGSRAEAQVNIVQCRLPQHLSSYLSFIILLIIIGGGSIANAVGPA